jgi:hypothetical protein
MGLLRSPTRGKPARHNTPVNHNLNIPSDRALFAA